MSAITNGELPAFATVEEVAIWAIETLVFLVPVEEIKTGLTTSQPYFARTMGLAADGQTVFYGTLVLPVQPDYNVTTGKIWKKSIPVKSVTVPAAFKTN
jgi:hypothetical protein